MRFGVVLPIQAADTRLDELWEQVVAEAQAAEAAGFEAVFVPEFHQARGGALTTPLLLSAALAQATTIIGVGTSVLAAPLHHPLALAEQVAMLDWTSRGRFILGVGTGHVASHFDLFGADHARRADALDASLQALIDALVGRPVLLEGPVHRGHGQLGLPVRTRPHPPLWIAGHGPRALARAGRLGDAWLADPQRDVATIAALGGRYRTAAAEAGRVPSIVLFRDGWIDDSVDACRRRWAPHALAVHRLYFNLGTYHRWLEPWVDDVTSRADFTFERLAPGRFLCGDAATITATVEDWAEQTGADLLAVRFRQPGGPGHQATLEAIARFGAEVIAPAR